MESSAILHVGEDLCFRIPVLQHAGHQVVRSESTVWALQDAFAQRPPFCCIVFDSELLAPTNRVVAKARQLSAAPLILFENPSVPCNPRLFDLVIDGHTSPRVWLHQVREAIARAQGIHEFSRRLLEACESIRTVSR